MKRTSGLNNIARRRTLYYKNDDEILKDLMDNNIEKKWEKGQALKYDWTWENDISSLVGRELRLNKIEIPEMKTDLIKLPNTVNGFKLHFINVDLKKTLFLYP